MTNVQGPIAEAGLNRSLAIGDSLKALVGAESAALSASRMSRERSAGELWERLRRRRNRKAEVPLSDDAQQAAPLMLGEMESRAGIAPASAVLQTAA